VIGLYIIKNTKNLATYYMSKQNRLWRRRDFLLSLGERDEVRVFK
jgi:hypothetical protein